ncbi:MAG: hypothetical protein E7324_03235 [Clostridiales bacterium]|nr:hypothetical protein [Clostridiales bacterium]
MEKYPRSKRNRYNKQDSKVMLLTVMAAALVLLVLVMPKEPVQKALNVATGEVSSHAGLRISEVMSDNAAALPDETGSFGDWIEIHNTLDVPMNLKHVGLSDRSDRIIFLFPDVTLAADGRVVVFCDDVNRDNPAGTFHAKFKISSLGKEHIYLFDNSGVVIDSVEVPTLNSDESLSMMEGGQYIKTYDYSPGFANGPEGHEAYLAQYSITPGVLMINEVAPSPRSGIRDEDDEVSDWVELFNISDEDISLANLALSDDETKLVKWTFPKDAVIPAGGYYLVYCSGKDKVQADGIPHTNFSINGEEETIVLSNLAGQMIDRVVVTGVQRDMSYGRNPDNLTEWMDFTLPTPLGPNTQAGMNRADQYLRNMNHTGVYISEIMSSADQVKAFGDAEPGDYVEIYNSSAYTWNLSGWGLSDNIGWPRKWTFPQGTSISPGEYKVILLDGFTGMNTNTARLRASFSLTRTGEEIMCLSDAEGRILDRVYLPQIPTDVSYGRTLNNNGFFYYDAPTPGQVNGVGFYGYTQAPVIETAGGVYQEDVQVHITVPQGTRVRYTTDGAIPTLENSQEYTGPITLNRTTVIRARAFQGGLQPSDTVTATYLLKVYHKLDIVSLVCDPFELWDSQTGLMSEDPDLRYGTVVDKSDLPFETPVYRNWGKIDRPAYVEIFDAETGTAYISQGIKMDLLGAYSLDMPQKSFKIRAQASLGEKYFNYPLFENRDYDYYKSFTLRNSGNDNVWTRVADVVQTRLIDEYLDSPILTLDWKPVVVYLNGQYWGHYNMRERKDRFSIAQHEGLDLEKDREIYENIVIARGNWSLVQGTTADSKEYRAMLTKFKTLEPNNKPEDLQYILDNIDVESFIEWFCIKGFFGDSDPGNIMYYKLPGGKWKCLMFDLDYGMYNSSFESPRSYLKPEGMGQQEINNVIFRKIYESDVLREQLLTRFGQVFQALTVERMQAMLDECAAIIKPELPYHYARWAPYKEPTINIDSPTTGDGYMRYWQVRVNRMRNETMTARPYKLWDMFQKFWGLSDSQMLHYFGPRPAQPGT